MDVKKKMTKGMWIAIVGILLFAIGAGTIAYVAMPLKGPAPDPVVNDGP